jgi:uncharacterized protein GlcG (DUF336 family)
MLTLDEATDLCTAARAAAADQGLAMSFAVMDAGGHLLAFVRMDGAPWVSADVAQGKAWTAAAYGVPSDAQKQKMAPMPNFAQAITIQRDVMAAAQRAGLTASAQRMAANLALYERHQPCRAPWFEDDLVSVPTTAVTDTTSSPPSAVQSHRTVRLVCVATLNDSVVRISKN